MSFMRTTREVSIVSEIPADIPQEQVLQKLHDHEFMLKLSPIVTEFERTEIKDEKILQNEPEFVEWFKVSEVVPIFGRISFVAAFKDQPEGLDSVVYAPAGLIMHVNWRVTRCEENDKEKWLLQEDNVLQANRALMSFITWDFTKVHREMQKRLFLRIKDTNDIKDT